MKKIISMFVIISLMLSLIPTSIIASEEANERVLVFSDDFTNGNMWWKMEGGWSIDGSLKNSNGKYFQDSYLNLPIKEWWGDSECEFDLKIQKSELATSQFCGVSYGGVTFRFSDDTNLTYASGTDTGTIGKGLFELDVLYNVKIYVKGRGVALYLRKDGEKQYKQLGAVATKQEGAGLLSYFSGVPTHIDNIKIYANSDAENLVENRIRYVGMGTESEIEVKNATGSLTYESADPAIATVDANGVITPIKLGTTVINVKDEQGKTVTYIAVKVINNVTGIRFTYDGNKDKVFYVGDTFSLGVVTTPSNAQLSVQWGTEGEGQLEIYGESNRNNTFTAVSPGKVSVIAKDRLGYAVGIFEVTVLPKEEKPSDESQHTTFGLTGESHKDNLLFGFHVAPLDMKNAVEHWNSVLSSEIQVQTIRNEQTWLQAPESRTATWTDEEAYAYWNGQMDAFPGNSFGNALKVPIYHVIKLYSADADTVAYHNSWSLEECMKMVDRIASENQSGHPMHIEIGNENYAISNEKANPRAEAYFSEAAKLAKMIKGKYPDTKCYAVMLAQTMETQIMGAPDHQDALKDDWAYTQAHRVDEWNSTAIKYKDSFDGFTIHDYFSTENVDGMTAENYIENLYGYSYTQYYGYLNMWERIGKDAPLEITETGQLNGDVFWAGGYDSAAKKRHQRGKYPISAMANMEIALNSIKGDVVDAWHLHGLHDSQGFGTFEYLPGEETLKMPNFHVFKELSDIRKENKFYYGIQDINGGYSVIERPFYTPTDENVILHNVEAWAFGDENKVNKVIFSNHTNVSQTVSLQGAQIKPKWSYGGNADIIAPSWSKNETYDKWNAALQSLPNGAELSPLPNTHDGATFEDTVEIPPYTMMTVEVSGAPSVIDGHIGKNVSASTEHRLRHGLVLKVGNSIAYNNNIKKSIDVENPAITPVIKDGRTLLPLRFVAESFGCEVTYDDATKAIKIIGNGKEIDLTVGKAEYTVNGEAKAFDVPAEVTDGRTLVPLRALAEALDKDVLWDTRGLIIITNNKVAYNAYDESTGVIDKGYIDEYDAKIDEILALF